MGFPSAPIARYRHKKRGTIYQVIDDMAILEADHSTVVVYRAEDDGQVWVRSFDEFFDGRFERVND